MASPITRRQFVAGAALTLGASGAASTEPTDAQPNVLVIHVDQHRIDALGAYGNTDIRTPHIDALAADGVRFVNSFCPYPVCTPSRYSMLSGVYVHQHRGWTNHSTLYPGTETFPSILRDAGYHTKAVGKMHFTPTYLDLGFQEMALSEQNGPGRWDDDYHRELKRHGLVDRNDLEDQLREYRRDARAEYWETFGALPSNLPDAFHSTTWVGDRALDTIEQWTPAGNLLMAGFIKPHHPFDPPAEWAGAYDPAKLTLLPGWTDACLPRDVALSKGYFTNEDLTEPALRRVMAYYYAAIEHIDHHVGRILAALKRKGLYDDALIIYTSDHGDYMGFHHMILKGNNMYDPLVKVPLIVKYPKSAHKGAVSQALVSNLDLAPTILAQAGRPRGPDMRGLDLADHPNGRDVILAEGRGGRHAMVRTKDRKLILAHGKGEDLFFDLHDDPEELRNRFADPERQTEIDALAQTARAWRDPDNLPKTHLDENAPIIDQPNVPSRDDDHRDVMIAYYQEKMDGERRAEG